MIDRFEYEYDDKGRVLVGGVVHGIRKNTDEIVKGIEIDDSAVVIAVVKYEYDDNNNDFTLYYYRTIEDYKTNNYSFTKTKLEATTYHYEKGHYGRHNKEQSK